MKLLTLPHWTTVAPVVALALAIGVEKLLHGDIPALLFVALVPVLLAAVFSAVHHAEVIAHRIGQPFGAIVLALSVTAIEVSLVVSLLLSAGEGESAVARDTVFAAIMIVLNGIVGLCLVVGGIRYHRQDFRGPSVAGGLGVLATLAVLALILPNFTKAQAGPVYAPAQLIFVSVVSIALYVLFLFYQTVTHRDDFLDPLSMESDKHVDKPSGLAFALSLAALPVALLAVVLLAEELAVPTEHAILSAGLPAALVGVVIALIVLMPEGIASLRAARQNRLQTSLNLAIGSALASLCLTIPAVAIISLIKGQVLVLGLQAEHIVLLVLTLFMSTLSLVSGRTTMLQGGIHLVIFAAFLTISAVP